MTRVLATLTALTLTAACMHTGNARGPAPDQAVPRPAAHTIADYIENALPV